MKKINTEKGFQYFYALLILIDSTYKKYKNYCSQVFLEYSNDSNDDSDEEKMRELISSHTKILENSI